MPDPNQTQNSDALSPEDAAALVHAQQQLYSAGDPRATKLYNYIVANGYATKDAQGNLQLKDAQSHSLLQEMKSNWQSNTAPIPSDGTFGTAVHNIGGRVAQDLVAPLVHPVDTAEGLLKSLPGVNPISGQVNQSPLAPRVQEFKSEWAKDKPLAIENAAGDAGALALQGATAGPVIEGAKAIAGPAAAALKSAPAAALQKVDAIGAKIAPSMIDGPPEQLITQAARPIKKNISWNDDVKTAIPLMKSAEIKSGTPIDGYDGALAANQAAKQDIWQQYKARLGPAAQQGATIDGNQIADAMVNSIDKRTAAQNPGLVQRVQAIADTYRRPLPVDEAEDFLQSANKDLFSYYAKNKVSRQAAENDPETSSTVAEADALRDALYNKLDQVSGPGAAQLKKAYGALKNVGNALADQKLVYERKAPTNLPEQLSYWRAGGKLLTGNVLGAAKDIAVQRFLSEVNDANSMITRAFVKAKPATPFPMPSGSRVAGLLPRGPIQTPPPADASGSVASQPPPVDATTRAQRLGLLLPEKTGGPVELPYVPEMSGGERLAALMQYLREHPQAALPAKASAIRLPRK